MNKHLIIIALCFLFVLEVFAQAGPTNANRYNVTVRTVGYYFNWDNVNGTNYPTFNMKAAVDNNGVYDCLLNSNGTGYTHTAAWDADTGDGANSYNYSTSKHKNILEKTNVNTTWADISTYAMEWYCGPRHVRDNCDGEYARSCYLRNVNSGSNGPGVWSYEWLNDFVSQQTAVRIAKTWRYYYGNDENYPLTLGTLGSGTHHRVHDNSNRRASGGAPVSMGYTDQWKTSEGPSDVFGAGQDVTYSFSITDYSRIIITTNYSGTSFDSKLILCKDLGGGDWEYITHNDDISSSNSKSRIETILPAGDYFIVVDGKNYASQGTFKLGFTKENASFIVGSIEHPEPWIREGCSITKPIQSAEDGSSSHGTTAYTWQRKPRNSSDWETIVGATGATLTGSTLGAVNEDIDIRRSFSSSLGLTEFSNTLTFESKTIGNSGYNGSISGKVTGKGGQGSVAGVSIYAVSDVHGQCLGHIDSTLTSSSGTYTLDNLYYGSNGASTTFKVYAKFLDHEFAIPDTLEVGISSNTERTNQNFEDITTIFLKGRLYQVDQNQDTCGITGNGFFLNDVNQLPKESDDLGYYDLAIGQRSSDNFYTVRPDTTDFKYTVPFQDQIFAVNDVNGIDFENVRRDTIRGSVTACGGYSFGQVNLEVKDLWGGCFAYIVTTDINGDYEIVVPAREYTVSVINVESVIPPFTTGAIENYFIDAVDTVDVTKEPSEASFIYHQLPQIEISGLPTIQCSGKADTVFYQGDSVHLEILITEINTGGCPMDTGILKIIDGISDRSEVQVVPFSNGSAHYTIVPGEPFKFDDFKKNFSIRAEDIERPNNAVQVAFKSYIDGNSPQPATFTTVSPEIPLLILRDPPGDKSYSYLNTSETATYATRFSVLGGGDVKVWGKVRAGATFETGFLGFSTEYNAWGSKEVGLKIASRASSQTESIMSITNETMYHTSADDSGIGPDADLFVGGAFNIKYALTDIIAYNTQTCEIDESTELIMGTDSLKTLYTYTASGIREITIPKLQQLKDLSTTVVDKNRYQNQINIWNQTLATNDLLKATSTPDQRTPNRSWDGNAGPFGESTTVSSQSSTTFEFTTEIVASIAEQAGLEVGGVGASGGVEVNLRLELGSSTTSTQLESRTVGYVLDDDDAEDSYNTLINNDRVYGTPVFLNESSATSCPYTGGSKIDNPVLSVNHQSVSGIDPDGQGEFTFTVTNGTELPPTSNFTNRSYTLDIDNASNPHGATIVVGGDGIFPLQFNNISRGLSKNRDLAISRENSPNLSIYSYEGLKFELQPVCGDQSDTTFTQSTKEISAYFISECSGVNLASPSPGWVLNSADNNMMSIHLTDYDKSKLTRITLQYSPAGLNQWTDGREVEKNDLNDNSTVGQYIDWNVPQTIKGNYDLRLKLTCPTGVIYSLRSSGLIDREAPQVFGLPSPIDDIYDLSSNDEISVSFTESINCDNSTATLIDVTTDMVIPGTITCNENTVQIVPNTLLPESAYRVILSGIQDLYQNTADIYRWVFVVGDYIYEPDCSPIDISNNNLNQDAISQSVYRAMEISSDGTIATATSVGYKAQESVTLESGFTVNTGGGLVATIENCEND